MTSWMIAPPKPYIGYRMNEIKERLDEIADERTKFNLREVVVDKHVELAQSRETSSFPSQRELYGRDEDKEKIIKDLLEGVCEKEDVSVYPIIGIGGLGKTTLAQMVFNDERVKRHFEPKVWVFVSQDFDVKRVIKATIESASGTSCGDLDLDSLQRRLQEMLNLKRYLIVLDDVWNEDQEKWDRLKYALACGSKGASIIATTRLKKVASIIRTMPPHHLPFLSEDECWLLFRQRAFGDGNEEHPNLVAIGKEIVKMCGGVPLAAKALGGLLRFKRDEKEWIFVKESDTWKLQDENSILPALRLSYSDLPMELRQCFAYCAVFPKGTRIEKENLIHLWMANGYISCKGKLETEDIGNQIWNELCLRSLFQDVNTDQFGCRTWFKMHDLVHDLAQSILGDECQIMEVEGSKSIANKSVRHITLVSKIRPVDIFPDMIQQAVSLRTIQVQCWEPYTQRTFMSEFLCDLTNFGSLRVLDARYTEMKEIPSSIGSMKHLRYLDLSHTQIHQLPDSICSLWNLQTLILENCWKLRRFPKKMKYLRSLRHLYLSYCYRLNDMPPNLGRLNCLKTLNMFVVGKSRGCPLAELQSLNLGGELCIKHLERVRNPISAKEANLVAKQNLRRLKLFWEDNAEFKSQENVEQLLESLEPHPNIKGLVIHNYKGSLFPLWMREFSLRNVVEIELKDCKNCSQLPPFGKLPFLKHLEISGMDKVKYIDDDFSGEGPVRGFPSLEVLNIYSLPNLKGLSREEGRELLPHLREMKIGNCPNLRFPCLLSLIKLEVWGKCTSIVLTSISNLQSLNILHVVGNEEVICFPIEVLINLTLLESLKIESFSKLRVFPKALTRLVALKSLRIRQCPKLEFLPEEGLRGLESLQLLEICDCKELSSLSEGLQHLTALEKLYFGTCPNLLVLPEGIKHLNSLQILSIRSPGKKFVSLPEALQHVHSLQSLFISCCPELTSLPEWLGNLTLLRSLFMDECPKVLSLPASMQSLTKLQKLYSTQSAPELARRCEKGKGEDWYKIAHVPEVSIFPL
ncbi:putative disease resistance protein RGA4 isoform X2 [Actinidia eriantha]|uniref:putative disease resistance protein RGA4 isoform X2 n=1 Tax=Actinidia eriantha TaxID=165200 RepID=UPI0025857956|nr:putative disease resistance protein RGA4 isoform X2 [Actinidia eriantha]